MYSFAPPFQSYPIFRPTGFKAERLQSMAALDARLADGPVLWLIEWPERGVGAIPSPDLTVSLAHAATGRDIRLLAHSDVGTRWLAGFKTAA